MVLFLGKTHTTGHKTSQKICVPTWWDGFHNEDHHEASSCEKGQCQTREIGDQSGSGWLRHTVGQNWRQWESVGSIEEWGTGWRNICENGHGDLTSGSWGGILDKDEAPRKVR